MTEDEAASRDTEYKVFGPERFRLVIPAARVFPQEALDLFNEVTGKIIQGCECSYGGETIIHEDGSRTDNRWTAKAKPTT